MVNKFSEKMIAGMTSAGSLAAAAFLTPPKYAWGVCGLIVAAIGVGLLAKNQWVESNPNQWLLVIRDGKMIKAGVGLKTFVSLQDTIVKFPSKVEKVSFKANNVTKEMQGVEITGFAFWSVYRDTDGPFRCYKYMEGGDANSNVQAMCESALRNLIANSSLDQVMRNRSHLRDNMKNDLKDQFKGWGVWLESVQITQVLISSTKLFNDLQAEFRQETRLKAQRIDLESNEKMQESRQNSQVNISQMNQVNATKRQQTRNNQQLKRRRQNDEFEEKKNQIQIQKLERDKKYELERLKNQLEKEQEKLSNENKLKQITQNFELQFMKKKFQVDKQHDDKTLQKYQIDTMERIYSKLQIKEIKINQFSSEKNSSLASILPAMGFGAAQLRQAQ